MGWDLCHSAARRLNPANQRGKAVIELKLQPRSSWKAGRVCSSVASWPRGSSHAKCRDNMISHPGESRGSAKLGQAQRLLCLWLAQGPWGGLAGELPQPTSEVALELLRMEVAAGGWHVLVQHLVLLSPGFVAPVNTTCAIPVTGY